MLDIGHILGAASVALLLIYIWVLNKMHAKELLRVGTQSFDAGYAKGKYDAQAAAIESAKNDFVQLARGHMTYQPETKSFAIPENIFTDTANAMADNKGHDKRYE